MKVTGKTATRFATAVVDTLVDVGEFHDLSDPITAEIVREAVVRQVQAPSAAFECIVDDLCAATWRLRPDSGAPVRLACMRVVPTSADQDRENRVNAAFARLAAQYSRRTRALR